MTLEGTTNLMRQQDAYRELQEQPLAPRQAALGGPAFRHQVLTEQRAWIR
jgi:hypothetical protein